MSSRYLLHLLYLLLILCSIAEAQSIINGVILDAKTRRPLPAANIQISGTYRGAIANQDGFFILTIRRPQADLLISYIGYESETVRVTQRDAGRELRIFLIPIILEGETITVIAEDPGMRIMREVIKRKLEWRDNLETYRARAYSRVVLENDSGIVSLAESTSETFWDKERGSREVIKTKEQSSNLQESFNIAFASYIPNFYDDDIRIAGYNIIGPTHPDAFDYYQFKLEDVTRLDKKKVFWIRVIPDSKLQPTFEGKLAVLDSAYALLEAELIPSESVRFPVPIQSWDVYYTQQFWNYGKKFWLPVDLRMSGSVKVGFTGFQIPNIIYQRIASLSDYQVNVALPDSLYEDEDFLLVDSLALAETEHVRAIPLSQKEDIAYTELDSTITLEKAFKPTGFLANMIEMTAGSDEDNGSSGIFSVLSPSLWFNRVDGLHAGVSLDESFIENLSFRMGATYKTGLKRGGYHLGLNYRTGKSVRWQIDASYSSDSELRYNSLTYSRTVNSSAPLFGGDDYFDYYWNKSARLETSARIRPINSKFAVIYHYQDHQSLNKQTDYNLVWSDHIQRPNPEIDSGILRALEFSWLYGGEFIPFGVIGQRRISFSIEHTLSGNFDYTRYRLEADWRVPTFLQRRLLPNALDIHVTLQTVNGTLPIQRFGNIDAALYQFSPFATLKTLLARPYEGEKVAALFWEHNFRTVPFELIGFDFLVDNGIGLIIHGAYGRTWINSKRLRELQHDFMYTDQFHHEMGISVNGILGLLRVDITQRIDRSGFYVGFGMNRFF
jgi:hypothetical protein